MKAQLNSEGILCIDAETEIEGYALEKWLKDHWDCSNNISADYMVVNTSPQDTPENTIKKLKRQIRDLRIELKEERLK